MAIEPSPITLPCPGPVPPIMAPTVPLGGNFTVVGNPNHDLDLTEVTLANCDSLTGSGQMLSIWSEGAVPTSGTWKTCSAGSVREGTSSTANRCIGVGIPDPATGDVHMVRTKLPPETLASALRGEIRALQRQLGVTTIMVTHDQEEALEVADEIVVINEGRVEQIGSPEQLYDEPANDFVMGFLGPVSRLRSTIEHMATAASGIHDARMLAAMVDDPADVTPAPTASTWSSLACSPALASSQGLVWSAYWLAWSASAMIAPTMAW